MSTSTPSLINTPDVEIWPAQLLRPRRSDHARLLSRALHVLRRKRDGRFLAAVTAAGLVPLHPRWQQEPGIEAALQAIRDLPRTDRRERILPLGRLLQRLESLGLDASYGERTGLPLTAEPSQLQFAGRDRYSRPLWLRHDAAKAWTRMYAAARADGIGLEAVSGYRSHDYQLGIFERKLARGLTVPEILTVNAAPGFSEHHSGRALDVSTPGEPSAEESFERTAAFEWLQENAGVHGFTMSYPRDNPHGIVYEPWHWYFSGDRANVDAASSGNAEALLALADAQSRAQTTAALQVDAGSNI